MNLHIIMRNSCLLWGPTYWNPASPIPGYFQITMALYETPFSSAHT